MTKNHHTPGPWIAAELTRRPVGVHYHWRIQTGENRDDDLIAIVPAEYPGDDAGEEANAALIAASPELLAACVRALPWLGKMIADKAHLNSVAPNDCVGAMQQLEAAIAKARPQ